MPTAWVIPAAQLSGVPFARGEGRLRHRAAAAKRINCAYSSFRCSRQKASVMAVTAAKVSAMAWGTFSD
jgi:hypothetical protein